MISVIVAVYQAERYLCRCVDSVLAQTIPDWELLLVDDGSTDNSAAICDEYARKDSRVRVFHEPHRGVSETRQCGLDNAQGEYSIHCDPDDWIEPNMLEVMLNKAHESRADLVMCDMSWDYPDHSDISKQKPSALDCDTILSEMYFHISSSVCNKLIRMECIRKFGIRYPKNINYVEDLFVLLQLFCNPLRVDYVALPLYHYDRYTNEGSLTRRKNIQEYKMGVDYIESHIDKSIYRYMDNLKYDVLCEAYENHIPDDQFRAIYPEAHRGLLMKGLKHPTRNWKFVEVGLALYHMPKLGKWYAESATSISRWLKRLSHRHY